VQGKAARAGKPGEAGQAGIDSGVWGVKSKADGGADRAAPPVFVYSTPSMNRRGAGAGGTPSFTLSAPLARSGGRMADVDAHTLCDISCTPPRSLNDTALSHNATLLEVGEGRGAEAKAEPGSSGKGAAMLDFGCEDAPGLIQVGESTPIGHSTARFMLRSHSATKQGATNPPRLGDSPLVPLPASEAKAYGRDRAHSTPKGDEMGGAGEDLGPLGSVLRLDGCAGYCPNIPPTSLPRTKRTHISPQPRANRAHVQRQQWRHAPAENTQLGHPAPVRSGFLTVPTSARVLSGTGATGRSSSPPPPSRTNRTRCVPHPVLIGHAASLSQVFSPSTFLLGDEGSPGAHAAVAPSTGKRRRDLISPPQRFLRDVRRPIVFSPSDEGSGSGQVPNFSSLLLDSARKQLH
jgi:hypothetical protein